MVLEDYICLYPLSLKKGRGSGNRRFPEKIESEKHNIYIN